ncbi:MAG: DUF262 domain-containing protein [Armatimonadia bacterium]
MFYVRPFEQKPLVWWQANRGKIDMEPEYQRHGRLWSKRDKAFLIDSMLNEYDIPKVYMADFTIGSSPLNRNQLSYAIIDGKQRLEAVFDFYDGEVPLNRDFVYDRAPDLPLAGLRYSDLQRDYPEIAKEVDSYYLTVMRVVSDDPQKINELFVRLNRGKPLTGAEVRNAMGGPLSKLVRVLAGHDFLTSCVRFGTSRGQDKNAVTKILLFEYENAPAETKRADLDRFAAQADDHDRLELSGRRVLDTLDRMDRIFLPRDELLGSAGVVPVIYWFIRNREPSNDPVIRDFLIYFHTKRKWYTGIGATTGDSEADLIRQYNILNRSTDDRRSHYGRLEILEQFYIMYRRERERR